MTNSNDDRFLTRREFLTAMGAVGISVGAAAAISDVDFLRNLIEDELAQELPRISLDEGHHAATGSGHRWGMLIDLKKCIGCDYCVFACQAVNNVSDDNRWNIHIIDETETGEVFHMTRPCMHCLDAPCVSVCPVYATYERDDGIVIMDYDRCIGCRYCQVACPYGARTFNWKAVETDSGYQAEWGEAEVERRPRGVAEKCTFCVHRIDAGLANGLMPGVDRPATPACVNVCPVEARVFGDLNNPDSKISQIIATTPTFRLREDLGTEPNVYYIPPEGMSL